MSEIPGYYSQDAVDAQYEQMIKEFGILGEEIEKLKAENKQLKGERDKLKEILDKHVLTIKLSPPVINKNTSQNWLVFLLCSNTLS